MEIAQNVSVAESRAEIECPEVIPDRRADVAASGDTAVFQSLDIRFIFAYALTMFQGPSARKTFVVACKKCRRDVPTGVSEFPFQSIVVECPLCGEKRRYLPSEIFLGRVDQLVDHQRRTRTI
jgi:hypothetical protein